MSTPTEKVEIVPAVVPLWAADLQVRIAKLEVKMNIIAALALVGTTAAVADLVRLMFH